MTKKTGDPHAFRRMDVVPRHHRRMAGHFQQLLLPALSAISTLALLDEQGAILPSLQHDNLLCLVSEKVNQIEEHLQCIRNSLKTEKSHAQTN